MGTAERGAAPPPQGAAKRVPRIVRFLRLMYDRGASDLHFAVGQPPMLRIHGELQPIRYRNLNEHDFERYIAEVAPPREWARLQREHDADFSYAVEGLGRFRVNLFRQLHGGAAVFRLIPENVFTIEQLGLPQQAHRLTHFDSGLVLVTGPSGNGKSTTLAALVAELTARRELHVITLEDPVEFVLPPGKGLVTQREIGVHTRSFAEALRAALREDPDAVMIGEMRDRETIAMALSAAESGLLVYGTMHTNSAAKAIDRIVNIFPPDQQDGARGVLGETLRAVLAQQLVPAEAGGRIPAVELLFGSAALASMIREGKTHQVRGYIQMGASAGMIAMDDALLELVRAGKVSAEVAYERAVDPRDLRRRLAAELGIQVGAEEETIDRAVEESDHAG